jgi:hypothetical protein
MCDYSLTGIPNRLAVEGERLIAYRFPNGVMGFVSQPELVSFNTHQMSPWRKVCRWFGSETPCAVCLPPGAKLILRDVPSLLRSQFSAAADEEVTFTQSGSPYAHRDAIKFRAGGELLLQRLSSGQVADVLSLDCVEPGFTDVGELERIQV